MTAAWTATWTIARMEQQGNEDQALKLYWSGMTQIKLRLAAIQYLYEQAQKQDPKVDGQFLFLWEQIALHFRKIMELIVFSSLVAHQDAYAKVYPDLADHWKIGKILEKLDKVHPDFFPKPTKIAREKGVLLQVKLLDKPRLTRDDLVWLYDTCGDLIHAFQPLKHGPNPQIDLKYTPQKWSDLIWGLLEEHLIRLADGKTLLLVQMASPPHGNVFVARAE